MSSALTPIGVESRRRGVAKGDFFGEVLFTEVGFGFEVVGPRDAGLPRWLRAADRMLAGDDAGRESVTQQVAEDLLFGSSRGACEEALRD